MDQATGEAITHASVNILKAIPSKPFLCLPMSALLYADLNDNHGIHARMVTGNLLYQGNYIFKQDFSNFWRCRQHIP
jgi:hypothetical protein